MDPLQLELSKTSATSLLASSVKFLPTSWPNGPQGSGHVAPPSYESIQEVLQPKISRENVRVLLKIREKRESFVPWNFCCLRYFTVKGV